MEHPLCRKEDILYDKDGIHLNKDTGTVQLLKDFLRVSTGKSLLQNLKTSNYCSKFFISSLKLI